MNWEMIGAVGEVGGAVGVVITLVYLARQIRQSNIASRQEAMRELLDQNARFLSQLGADPQVARVYRRGMAADPTLSDDELVQFRALVYQLVFIWERLFNLDQVSRVDPWVVENNRATRREIAGAPGFRAGFESRKHWLGAEFREVMEKEIASGVGYDPRGRHESPHQSRGGVD